jgi:hypothetical protein
MQPTEIGVGLRIRAFGGGTTDSFSPEQRWHFTNESMVHYQISGSCGNCDLVS